MPPRASNRRKRWTKTDGMLRRFSRRENGSAAIEFGMVFPAFVAVLCGTIFAGTYFFEVARSEAALRSAADVVMTMTNATAEEVSAALNAELQNIALSTDQSGALVEISSDGTRFAVMTVDISLTNSTPFLNTAGFGHSSTVRVPLLDRE